MTVGGKRVQLSQQTSYPWNGDITITVDKNAAGSFALKIRIPGWLQGYVLPSDLYSYSDDIKSQGYTCTLNGEEVLNTTAATLTADGYLTLADRKWKKGDRVQLHFDMQPRTVRADAHVREDRGMICVERGPLVYCAERPDGYAAAENDFDITRLLVNQKPHFQLGSLTIANTPVTTLITDAQLLDFDAQGRLSPTDVRLTLIPYYAWCHRGSGKMRVWLRRDL